MGDLHARQVDWCREQAESYQAYRRANGEPDFTTSGAWPVRRAIAIAQASVVAAAGPASSVAVIDGFPPTTDPDALF